MPAYKDAQKGTWYAAFYYQDWKGIKKKKLKRGFPTKKEALAWERTFLLQQAADLTMTFEAFVEIYIVDKQNRLRENTWSTKEHIIRTKILPYFKEKRLCDIKPQDVIAWQNELLNYRGKNGKPYSPTYLKTLHSQFSAILNHAVRFYGLNKNAATTAGNMGSSKHQEMLFWTKEEYLKFAEVMMDKPLSYYAFEILYWCGIREGELLALTPADFDLDKGLLSITKSYQRLNGKDVITDPKTPKSVRVVQMPDFLTEEIRDYLKSIYNNVYSLCLPIPKIRKKTPYICIEHLYSDEEITRECHCDDGESRRLFIGNEFDDEGFSVGEEKYFCENRNSCGPDKINIIDGSDKKKVIKPWDGALKKNYALSKMEFAKRILNKEKPFDNMDFSNFIPLFEIIRKILNEPYTEVDKK